MTLIFNPLYGTFHIILSCSCTLVYLIVGCKLLKKESSLPLLVSKVAPRYLGAQLVMKALFGLNLFMAIHRAKFLSKITLCVLSETLQERVGSRNTGTIMNGKKGSHLGCLASEPQCATGHAVHCSR